MDEKSTKIRRGIPSSVSGLLFAVGATSLVSYGMEEAQAQSPIVIKMATLAPEGTPYYDGLQELAKEFKAVSGGQVQIKLYAGGVSGNETQMIRKMKIGQLHAAQLTSAGLGDMDKGAISVQIPRLIQTWEELDFIMAKLGPELEKRLEGAGFKVLGWGDVGWARFFTKDTVASPTQLKQVKLFAWEGDPAAVQAFKNAGLNPVVIASTDMLPSLQTGLINAIPTTALAALSYQWFGIAKNMVDLKWAPMIGANVIELKSWQKIPADLQPKLLEAGRKVSAKYKNQTRQLDDQAVGAMKRNGLTVVTPSAADMAEWEKFAQSFYPLLRGTMMDATVFDSVIRAHNEYVTQKR